MLLSRAVRGVFSGLALKNKEARHPRGFPFSYRYKLRHCPLHVCFHLGPSADRGLDSPYSSVIDVLLFVGNLRAMGVTVSTVVRFATRRRPGAEKPRELPAPLQHMSAAVQPIALPPAVGLSRA